MSRVHFLTLLFGTKIFLDFFVPIREVGYVALTALSVCTLLLVKYDFRIRPSAALAVAAYAGLCIFWYTQSGTISDFVKFISLPLVYFATRIACSGVSIERIGKASSRILSILCACFLGNYFASLIVASPIERSFFAFEHANILGSYILFAAALILVASMSQSSIRGLRASNVAMAALSTSTGAAILSVFSALPIRRLRMRSIAGAFILVVAGTALSTLILKTSFEGLYTKIYGPFLLLWNEGLDPIITLARSGAPIQELGDQYQSSLTWRFYAYVVYFDFLARMPMTQLLFGSGFEGYFDAWNGMMPHNDYILTVVNFGLVPFALGIVALARLYSRMKRMGVAWRLFAFAIGARLMLENNISSFYLLSFGLMCLAMLHSVLSHNSHKEGLNASAPYN